MKHILIVAILILLAASSCSNNTTGYNGTYTPQGTTLIQNSTFDSSAHPTLGGWTYGSGDIDSIPQFQPDGPPPHAGTQWSIALAPGWIPSTTFVYRDFTGLSSGVYSLTAWARLQFGVGGRIEIEQSGNPFWKTVGSPSITDPIWQQYTVLDTMTLSPKDTVRVLLTGGTSERATGRTLYDNISFTKLP